MADMSLAMYRRTFQTKIQEFDYHDNRTRELYQELEELLAKLTQDYPDQAEELMREVTKLD